MIGKSFCILLFIQVALIAAQLTESQKCMENDSACLVRTAQALVPYFTAGIQELGIEPLDVMHMDKIDLDVSGLKLHVKDATVKGLRKSVIDKIEFNMKNKILEVAYTADVVIKGKYKASGRLLILPITGDGDYVVKLKTMKVNLMMPFNIAKNQDGKDVIELTSYKHKSEVVGNAHFNLTNLFNGNKETSDALLTFMNQNWKQLQNEFSSPTFKRPNEIIYLAIKKYLLSQPKENLFLRH